MEVDELIGVEPSLLRYELGEESVAPFAVPFHIVTTEGVQLSQRDEVPPAP